MTGCEVLRCYDGGAFFMPNDLAITGSLTSDEVRRRVGEFEWYHCIDLGNGIVTPGQFDLAPLLPHYGIPDSLEGKSVLDVGPGHGFFAFEFERRRARRVVTCELPDWTEHDSQPRSESGAGRRPASMARRITAARSGLRLQARGSRLERQFCNIYDLSPERVGTFDVVFCASVLLHLTDPLRALYALRRVCADRAIICTAVERSLAADVVRARALRGEAGRPCVLAADAEMPHADGACRRVQSLRGRCRRSGCGAPPGSSTRRT